MAYTTFPDFAQLLLDDYGHEASGGVIRDEMEDGFIHQGPKQSLGRRVRTLGYRLAEELYPGAKTEFDRWYREDLRRGALHFAWPDPETGADRRVRIIEGKVNYAPLTNRFDDWSVTFSIEYWE